MFFVKGNFMDHSSPDPSPGSEPLASPSFDVLETISDGLFTLDPEWRFTYLNARAESLLRRSRSELLGKNIWQEYPQATETVYYREYHRAAERNERVEFEAYFDVLNAWLLVRISPYAQGLCILLQDITARKVADAQRQEQVSIIDSSFDAILGKTLEGIITSWNPSAERLYGYTREEVLGQHISLIVPADRAHELPPIMERLRRGERIETFETVRQHKDGSLVHVSVTIAPIRNAQGVIVGASTIAHNITEQKQAEEILRARETRLNGILVSAMDAILSIDAEQNVVLFNAAAERMFRCSAVDALGSPLERFIPARFHALHARHVENFGKTGVTNRAMGALTPLAGLRADGEEFPIEATISQIEVQGQKLYTAILRDVSERKRLEEQFLHSQKMEGIGRLAGGIVHDFNNLLAAIMGYAELAEIEAPNDGPFREYLANVSKAAERAATLTSQLLAFARKQISEPKFIDFNELVLDLEKLLRRLIGEDIALDVVLGERPVVIHVDPSQLAQVLINLAVNARDAMPDGGKITIEVSTLSFSEPYSISRPDIPPGRYAALHIKDTGVGMTEEVKSHLFEPFYTTKPQGKGTGLGLATSYGIVKQSGGGISVESEPGQGTTFTIYLPCVDESPTPLPALRMLARMPVGTETILVVEDEPLVRGLAVQILRSLNYTTFEASDGQEAIDIVDEMGGVHKIDLLVTDVIMPRVGGHELVLRLSRMKADLKVLYCSGYTDDEIVKKGVLDREAAFLQKPYTPSMLAVKVRQVLDVTDQP
jgi:PAS domain S-box-containing protein